MRVTMASVPARPGRVNEDFVAAVPNAAVLVDGAGISGIEAICRHGIAWYAHRLGAELLARLSLDALAANRDLPTLLADSIERVTDEHRDTCDVADPSSPSATVVALRLDGDRADYLVLADSFLVLDRAPAGDEPFVVVDSRERDLRNRHHPMVDATAAGSVERERAVQTYRMILRASRNQPGGFWVAKDDPRAASEAVTGSVRIEDLAGAALLSNGASRHVDRFALTDWRGLLGLLDSAGPDEVVRRVRRAESVAGEPPDDASVAYCTRFAT